MYLHHFGLRDKPFKLAYDPAYYFSAAHQVPLNELCYSIEERQGLAILIGEPGTGKTTLLKRLLKTLSTQQLGVFITDPSVVGKSVVRQLASELRVTLKRNGLVSLEPLKERLAGLAEDHTVVFIVDEAQGLTPHQLKELRHLTNLEIQGRRLIEIILSGQPSLESVLAAPNLAALSQRVAVRCQMGALNLEHTRAYMEHRLRVAGARNAALFTPDATRIVFQHSRGIPRLINIIGDRALVVCFLKDETSIDGNVVDDAVADLRLEQQKAIAPPEPRTFADNKELKHVLSRIKAIEGKLDRVLELLTENGQTDRSQQKETKKRRVSKAPTILPEPGNDSLN